jgi:hypothetical protein
MPVGGVVGDDVDDDLEAEPVGVGQEAVEVGQRAEDRVDVAVVGHVVPAVDHGGAVERRQPDRVDPEVGEVGQAAAEAGEVADPVTVGVGEAARIDLVDHRISPPSAHIGT